MTDFSQGTMHIKNSQPTKIASPWALEDEVCLTSMLHDFTHEHTILDVALELLWQRALLSVIISALLRRKVDVDSRGLAGKDLGVETLLTEVNGSAVNLVQEQGGGSAVNLESKLRTLDNIETADQGVDDERKAITVVDGDGVGLVSDLDDGLVATSDQNRLVLLRGDLNDITGVVEVLDEPLVTLEFLARRLTRAHVLGLGLLARRGRLAAVSAGTLGDGRAGTQAGVLVSHL